MAKNQKIKKEIAASDIDAIMDSAVTVTTESIDRPLTVKQIEDYGKRQVLLAERETEIEDNIKDYTEPLKEELKSIKAERRSISVTTKSGFIESDEKLYWNRDTVNKEMVAYDKDAIEIKRRPMKPEELQLAFGDIKNNLKALKDVGVTSISTYSEAGGKT